MPSSSKSQYKLMQFAAINKEFAEKKGIKQETAKEWHAADQAKKKEDPTWYDNLPEKFEKKKKDRGESMEGFQSWLFHLVTGGTFKDSDPDHPDYYKEKELSAIEKMIKDEKILDKIEMREGKIDVKNINSHLLLRHFNESNWLSELEKGVLQIDNYANKFFDARLRYSDAMRKVYEKCETMKPQDALDYALKAVPPLKMKLDAISPPTFLLAINSEKKTHGYKFTEANPGPSPFYMEALSKGQVKKLLTLMPHLFQMDGFGNYELEHLYWTLDDTDEHKWWAHHYPDDDHIWSKMLNLFPYAGEFDEYDYETPLNTIITKIRRGCEELINKSVK